MQFLKIFEYLKRVKRDVCGKISKSIFRMQNVEEDIEIY
jgi:hypothetical protein